MLIAAVLFLISGCAAMQRSAGEPQASKAAAQVTLRGLDHTYDGTPKAAEVTTDPAGLDVSITYGGNSRPPVKAGSYAVVAVVRHAGYEGSASGTLTIARAPQQITFGTPVSRTYGGKPFDLDASVSSGLKPVFASDNSDVVSISGNRVKIRGAGTAVITASQPGDHDHLPAEPVQQTLVVRKAAAAITLSELDHTYDGRPKQVRVRTEPRDLPVKITYGGREDAPVHAGSYKITAMMQDANYEGSASAVMTIAKAPQKITFQSLRSRTFGDADLSPGASASSGNHVSYSSSLSGVATVVGDQVHISGAGTAVITAEQHGDADHLPAEPVQRTLMVNKAPAGILLEGLAQSYDGKPKQVTFATNPAGLSVHITYDGGDTLPVNAGTYKCAARIDDANYTGSVTATMTIARATQTITFDALASRTFGDASFVPGAVTSAGLTLTYRSSDPRVAAVSDGSITIVGAGGTTITATQGGDRNYLPASSVQQMLIVNKALATITLDGLTQTYDGKAKAASSATVPAGLKVSITYAGTDKAPVNAGNYAVMARVEDANYEGSATSTMTIAKAAQTMTFAALTEKTYGDRPFDLGAALSSGLQAVYESSDPQIAAIRGREVTIVGAGKAVITASQPGNENYLPAEPVMQTLMVDKAPAKVVLGNLAQTYDGQPKQALGTTRPEGLKVSFTYDGGGQAPVNAGSYQVEATVQERNYKGSSSAMLTIARAPQTITFGDLSVMTYSEIPFRIAAAVSSGLTATFTSSNAAIAVVSGDQVLIKGVGTTTITAYQAGDGNHLPALPVQRELTVKKAEARVLLGGLEQTYDGEPKRVQITTTPAGLNVSIAYEGSDKAPVNAGTYQVVGTVQEANYAGSTRAAMTIAKAPQGITFNALAPITYGDETPHLLFAIPSSGLTATYLSSETTVATVAGNEVKIRSTGTTTITAFQAGGRNFLPADPVQQRLTVKAAKAWVALNGIDVARTYDGRPKRAMVTTSPEGLHVRITYNGSDEAPVDAGKYKVVANVHEANYEATASGTLTIAPAFQELQLPILKIRTMGDEPFDLPVLSSSGLKATCTSSDPSVATVADGQVRITGAGTTMLTAYQTGDRNYQAAVPVKRLLVVRSRQPRIVVLPLENLSGRPVPLHEIRQEIIQGLISRSAVVLDDGEMQRFMARHRVRYVGGVDLDTAKKWREEEAMEAVLVTSVDQYEDSEVPKIAITSRLVTTGETPYILWMENADLSGDDSFGLFGVGLIDQIGKLQEKAVRQLVDSLTAFYAGRPSAGASAVTGAFDPKVEHETPFFEPNRSWTIAVMPFYNRSKQSRAGEVLALRFVSQLAKNRAFNVMEPGVVRQKLLNYRMIMKEGPSRADMKSFFLNLDTDLILVGRLLQFGEANATMEFDVQVYEKKSGSTVWSSWSYNRGNDAVLMFDWGRVNNAGALASKMARSIVQSISSK
jgi:TolB-like protein